MKRLLIILCFLPLTAFAAPSVRMLGGKGVSVSAANSNLAKVEKAKINVATSATTNTAANTVTTSPARIGTLRAKTPKTETTSGAMTSSLSRLPVIVPAKGYDSASYTGGYNSSGDKCCSVDVDAIIAAVMEKVDEGYYNKNVVYNNENFVNAVLDLINDDDPRIDAIKIGSKPVHEKQLPSDYVYMWIER